MEDKKIFAEKTYKNAVSDGHYELYMGGLCGKHDNVRTYWEDQIRGLHLRPYLNAMVNRKQRAGEKIRIIDLGAGSGEGIRLLTSWNRTDADLNVNQTKLLPLDMIECYVGSDLSEAMVEQGNKNFADSENIRFLQGDFSQGFPHKDEEPFDIYFCSYASFSHLDDDQMKHLLDEIIDHANPRSLVVGEWLGRHSIEWPCYWDKNGKQMLDYSMSWLHGSSPSNVDIEHYPVRYWTGDEMTQLIESINNNRKHKLKLKKLHDCSIFVGRHVNTREYNDDVPPLRNVVNRLHEENFRTELNELFIDYIPTPGHDELNHYFAELALYWNTIIDYAKKRIEKRYNPAELKNWSKLSSKVQIALMNIDRVLDAAYWIRMGDPRANIIEPQIGYALRGLEMEFQRGLGRGHSLIGIFEVQK